MLGRTNPLSDLLASDARRRPNRILWCDQPGRESWCDRPARTWNAAEAAIAVEALAGHLRALPLPARALVGLCLPGGSEAALALLATERAGLTPCLLPLTVERESLARIIEGSGIQAIITQTRVGDHLAAEMVCAIAVGYFRLRFLMAFGPNVPDGVVDLDEVIDGLLAPMPEPPSAGRPEAGVVTLSRHAAGELVFRPYRSLIAATASILVPARIRPGDRILSLLAPDDLRGLATGPIAALLSGATFEGHAVFDGATLLAALDEPRATHLVAPAWMEEHLGPLDMPEAVASIILVHEAPVRFQPGLEGRPRILDILAFGEFALLAGTRQPGGSPTLSVGPPGGAESLSRLLTVRIDEDGGVSFGGPASLSGWVKGSTLPDIAAAGRQGCGFTAEVTAGLITAVS